jgi:hypothetical protein
VDELLRDELIQKQVWGNIVAAYKAAWLGSSMLSEVDPAYVAKHARETALQLIRKCSADPPKAIILASAGMIGAVEGRNHGLVLIKDGTSNLSNVLVFPELSEPSDKEGKKNGFIAYMTLNALLQIRHVHVFSLKRPLEVPNLARLLRTYVANGVGDACDAGGGSEMQAFHVRYLGSSLVSAHAFWRQELLATKYKPSGKKSNDDFFDAATIVLTEPLAVTRASDPRAEHTTTTDDTGVLVTPEAIRVVDALTQEQRCTFMPVQVTEIRVMDLPKRARLVQSKKSTSPGKHVLPQTSRMTEAERINLMTMVRDGKIDLNKAIDKAVEAEETDEKLLCLCREDMIHTNTIHVDVMLCTLGAKYVQHA